MTDERQFPINEDTYNRCVQGFEWLEKHLGINIILNSSPDLLSRGEIFLFNHFTRFETLVPPYLINKHTGAYCRSVADHGLFNGSDRVTRFLYEVGVLPNDLPQLMPFLAAEVLRGRKVVVFPEGGMVKDRSVVDKRGEYNVYSPSAGKRRLQHRGAAVIANTLDIFKKRILSVEKRGETKRLERWVAAVGLESVEALLERAREPTLIVPAYITFYPLRVTENILQKGAKIFFSKMSGRLSEELIIEGNILFKDTDMDIRLGKPVDAAVHWRWWEKVLLSTMFERTASLVDLFSLRDRATRWDEKMMARCMCNQTLRIRDEYMRSMYSEITVNFSHLVASIVVELIAGGRMEIGRDELHKAIYLSIKNLQNIPSVHLHQSLLNPEKWRGLLEGSCPGLDRFMTTAKNAGLIGRTPRSYRFMNKLCAEYEFNEIRIENPVMVYANEVVPVTEVRTAIIDAMQRAGTVQAEIIASDLFDDELRAHAWNKKHFKDPAYDEINAKETARENGAPYLLLPKQVTGIGIVMIHGFLASPAELRPFAEKLVAAGHPVIGVRLSGHGTSPCDLRHREWREWLDSVHRGYQIMSAFSERIAVVGFSSGGALALRIASEEPQGLACVAAVGVPLRFKDRRMVFVPLVNSINKLTQWLPSFEGVMPFRDNESEHPDINYKSIPLHGLYQLRHMAENVERRLPSVSCPLLIMQSDGDPVVDPQSANIIDDTVSSEDRRLVMVPSERHGILADDIGGTQNTVQEFLNRFRDIDISGRE